MATFKLSLEDVKRKPEAFLYVFASDSFCSAMGSKASKIIKQKRANQRKILIQSAQNAGLQMEDYTNAIRDGFIETYGMKPAEALVKLAQGEEVAGKNWAEGVYGVGAVYSNQFSQSPEVTVDKQTGKILVAGVEAQGQTAIIGSSSYPENIYGYSYTDGASGATYTSRYRKVQKAYFANMYSDKDGNKQSSTGIAISSADGNVWENTLTIAQKILNWLISLFGGTTSANLITEENTVPSQTDGFVTQEAGIGTVGVVLLAALAAGTLLNKKGNKK